MKTPGASRGRHPGVVLSRPLAREGPAADYSTVTLLARLRGWSTSFPRISATW